MTEPVESPPAASVAVLPAAIANGGWQPLPAAAGRIAMLGGALAGLPFGIAAAVLTGVLLEPGKGVVIATGAAVLVVAAIAGALLARARARRTRWQLDDSGLHVRRGLVWHSERLVPRSRVQHLDLERGPIERQAGLATLIVHTAGTRLHALRQAGFADADAVALRDALLPARERDDDVL
jgi:membrane protein YdbS with pleckstrin-like domain